jgi:poly(3-hydroxybutyrate) depolymerase
VRVAVAAVLLVLGVATLTGARTAASAVLSAQQCASGPDVGTPKRAGPGLTRVDYTFAHRIRGRCRTIVTQVRTPSPAPVTPLPAILAIHGLDGTPNALAPLLGGWTKAGYVVVAPTFPKTAKDARGKALRSEVVDQAADARFVLDEVLDHPSTFRVDPQRVGAAGMSLGGMTVYGLISHPCCEDGRVRAAVVMAGVHDAFPSGTYVHQDVPTSGTTTVGARTSSWLHRSGSSPCTANATPRRSRCRGAPPARWSTRRQPRSGTSR